MLGNKIGRTPIFTILVDDRSMKKPATRLANDRMRQTIDSPTKTLSFFSQLDGQPEISLHACSVSSVHTSYRSELRTALQPTTVTINPKT
jgi:hypothetical protein